MRFLNKKHGFTLVEIIVALGLLGIVGLGAGTYLTNSFKNSTKLASKVDVQNSVTSLMNKFGTLIKTADVPVFGENNQIDVVENGQIHINRLKEDLQDRIEINMNNKTVTIEDNEYKHIQKIRIVPILNEGKNIGGTITIVGEDELYKLTSTYYTRNTISSSGMKEINKIIVTYYSNDGTGVYTEIGVDKGDVEVNPGQNFERDGYDFKGWSKDKNGSGTIYSNGTIIENVQSDLELYAVWVKLHTVSYHANGGTGTMDAETVEDGSEVTLQENKFTRNGWSFKGWSSDSNSSDIKYKDEERIENVQSDLELYAVWVKLYTVRYHANDGTGTTKQQIVEKDKQTSLEENTFTRGEDWAFNGWNTKADGSGTSYADKAQITPTGNLTLYAIWKGTEIPTMKERATWFNSSVDITSIEKIEFKDYAIVADADVSWAAGIDSYNYIMCYVKDGVLTISGNGTGSIYANQYSSEMFANFKAVESIEGITILDTSNVTYMENMFAGCSRLTSVDISNLDKLKGMDHMFWGCVDLTNVKISGYTNQLKDMSRLFDGCSNLKSVDLTGDTSAVEGMYGMFDGCSSLTSLDLSSFNTSAVRDMNHMFNGCSSLTSLDLSSFNTSAVIGMISMFNGCSSLESLAFGDKFYTSAVVNMSNMFYNCNSLTSLNISNFNTNKVTAMTDMFKSMSKLQEVTIGENFSFTGKEGSGTSCTLPEPTIPGADGKWYTADGTGYLPADVPSKVAATYCAVKPVIEYTITYNANGGTGTMALQKVYSNSPATLTLNTFTKEGYDFCGWATSAGSTSVVYTDGQKIEKPTSNLNLYVVWTLKQNGTAKLVYDANGGNGAPAEESVALTGTKTKHEFTVSSTEPTRTGYIFIGWSVTSTGTATYQSGSKITIGNETKTIYAIWATACTVTYNANDGTGTTKQQNVEKHKQISLEENTFIRTGWTFKGWAESVNGEVKYADKAQITPTGNLTLYAIWKGTEIPTMKANSTWFNSSVDRTSITKIEFKNYCVVEDAQSWAAGTDSYNYIMCYVKDGTLTISGNGTGKIYANADSSNMFSSTVLTEKFSSTQSITLDILETSKVTNMKNMFSGCRSLTSLDLSSFITSSVKDMDSIFLNCISLSSLTLSDKFITSSVVDMGYMFAGCSSLTSLDLSNFETNITTDMAGMFRDCGNLTSLDLSDFKTNSVENMTLMFFGCSGLTSLDLSKFVTSEVTYMSSMFRGCSGLTSLDLSNFVTSKVTNMSSMFNGCIGLTSLDVSKFDTSKVTNMSRMFTGCRGLTSLDVSSFDTSKVTDMASMFNSCSSLKSLDVSGFKTGQVTDMAYMFYQCMELESLDLSNFNTSAVTDMSAMFWHCLKLKSVDVSNFVTSEVTDMSLMFRACPGLRSLDVRNFDTSNVTNMNSMFSACSNLTMLDLSGFDTTNVSDMTDMLDVMSCLREIRIGSNFSFTGKEGSGTSCTLPEPSIAEFDGKWYTDDGTGYLPADVPSKVAATYYAIKPIIEYTITYNANGGTGTMDPQTIEQGSAVTLNTNAFTRGELKFAGWATSIESEGIDYTNGQTITPTSDLDLYARWKVELKYDANGGSGAPATEGYVLKGTETSHTFDISSTIPTKNGWDFVGWSTIKDGTATYWDGRTIAVSNGEVTLYAVWKKDITLTYVANLPTDASGNKITAKDLPESTDGLTGSITETIYSPNTSYTFTISSANPTNMDVVNGYIDADRCVFEGWAESIDASSKSYSAGGSITLNESKTLYGVWNYTYTLVFNANGGSCEVGSYTSDSSDYTTASHNYETYLKYINPSINSSHIASRTGYIFKGWSFDSSKGYAEYGESDSTNYFYYTSYRTNNLVIENKPLYAVWESIDATYGPILEKGSNLVGATVGSYVEYVPTSTSYSVHGGNKSQTYNPSNTKLWRVFNINDDGTVDLISADVVLTQSGEKLCMQGQTGYTSLVNRLQGLAQAYVDDTYTIGARHLGYSESGLTSDQITKYNKITGSLNYDQTKYKEFPYLDKQYEKSDSGLNVLKVDKYPTLRTFNMVWLPSRNSGTYTYYTYYTDPETEITSSVISDGSCTYFQRVALTTSGSIEKGGLLYGARYNGFSWQVGWNYGIRPIVTLKAGLMVQSGNGSAANPYVLTTSMPAHTITFNANGGTGTMANQNVNYNTTTTNLTENTFTREGWTFEEWNTQADGKGTAYADKASITLTDDLNLYAIWKGAEIPNMMANSSWWNSNVSRTSITKIEFKDYCVVEDAQSWSAGTDNYNYITCYVKDGTLTISGNGTGSIYANADSSFMFNDSNLTDFFSNVTSITGMELLDTSKVTNMFYMFGNCKKLENLDVSKFVTNNVTDMSAMFYNCQKITTLNVSSFVTTRVKDMGGMFQFCNNLTSLIGLGNFNTSNVEDMSNMFWECNLTTLDLSSFNTVKVKDMSGMFAKCGNLKTITLGSNFTTSAVTNMYAMFNMCYALTGLDVSNFDTANVTNMKDMFSYCEALTSLDLSNFNTANVTNMNDMFSYCEALTSLDLSNFNTTNVTDMAAMFNGCSSLTSLDLSSFNTSKVTNMGVMFQACSKLTSLDLSNFNTSKVTDMAAMFNLSKKLTSLDLSSFNTSAVTDMRDMFGQCDSLVSLDLSNFNTSAVTYMTTMFYGCDNLVSLNLSNFDTSSVTSMNAMFSYLNELQQVILGANFSFRGNGSTSCTLPTPKSQYIPGADGNWYTADGTAYAPANVPSNTAATYYAVKLEAPTLKTSRQWWNNNKGIAKSTITEIEIITDAYTPASEEYVSWAADDKDSGDIMCYVEGTKLTIAGNGTGSIYANTSADYMFSDFSGVKTIKGIKNINTSKVTNMQLMFSGCSSLTSIDLSGLDTSNVKYMNTMFNKCSNLRSVNLSGLNTSKVTTMGAMFSECSNLRSINLSGLDTSEITDMSSMFRTCSKLTDVNLSGLDTSAVTTMSQMFQDCSSLTNININNLDTNKVTNMQFMFSGCSSLVSLDLSDLDTSAVTTMYEMFKNCSKLTSIDFSGLDTSNALTNMYCMFNGCSSLTSVDLSGIDTSKVTTMWYMFNNCNNLQEVTLGIKFSFYGTGEELLCRLPTPKSQYIPGADGNWYTADGTAYAPANVPSNTAATYCAVKPVQN